MPSNWPRLWAAVLGAAAGVAPAIIVSVLQLIGLDGLVGRLHEVENDFSALPPLTLTVSILIFERLVGARAAVQGVPSGHAKAAALMLIRFGIVWGAWFLAIVATVKFYEATGGEPHVANILASGAIGGFIGGVGICIATLFVTALRTRRTFTLVVPVAAVSGAIFFYVWFAEFEEYAYTEPLRGRVYILTVPWQAAVMWALAQTFVTRRKH